MGFLDSIFGSRGGNGINIGGVGKLLGGVTKLFDPTGSTGGAIAGIGSLLAGTGLFGGDRRSSSEEAADMSKAYNEDMLAFLRKNNINLKDQYKTSEETRIPLEQLLGQQTQNHANTLQTQFAQQAKGLNSAAAQGGYGFGSSMSGATYNALQAPLAQMSDANDKLINRYADALRTTWSDPTQLISQGMSGINDIYRNTSNKSQTNNDRDWEAFNTKEGLGYLGLRKSIKDQEEEDKKKKEQNGY